MIRESKKIGFQMLKENFGLIFGSYLLYLLISVGIGMIGGVLKNDTIEFLFSIVSFILSCVFQLGIISIFVKIYYGKESRIKDLFSFFSDSAAVGKNILLNAIVIFLIILFSTIACIIYLAFAIGDIEQLRGLFFGLLYGMGSDANIVGLLISTLVLLVIIILFSMLVSAIVDFGTIIIVRKGKLYDSCISNAFSIGLKNMFKYLGFQLSFIGWILLGSLIMGFGFVKLLIDYYNNSFSAIGPLALLISVVYIIFLVLYVQSSFVVFANKILDRDYGRVDEESNSDTVEMNFDYNIIEDINDNDVIGNEEKIGELEDKDNLEE